MIDASPDYAGRPYGGVSLICSSNSGTRFVYEEAPCDNKRIVCVKVMTGDNTHIKTIIGVYMPYYKNDTQQTEEYLAALSDIQIIIDEFAPLGPLQIVGDLNAQLPKSDSLCHNWYKKKGFTLHSRLLKDFIDANDLVCSDIVSKQELNYTYFQHETGAFTWIDHVISTQTMHDMTTSCKIIDHHESNTSDHLPIQNISHLKFSVPPSGNTKRPPNEKKVIAPFSAKPNWDNFSVRDQYHDKVKEKLNALTLCLPHTIENPTEYVSELIKSINNSLIQASEEVSHGPKNKQYKPKHFWCPELTKLKKQKQFWWSLWLANGRPHNGHIYEIWKLTKKAYRKFYRNKACDTQNIRFSKLNHLFNNKRPSFWSLMKHKRKRAYYNVDTSKMAEHFKNTLTDTGKLTPEQSRISDTVKHMYKEHHDKVLEYQLDELTIGQNINKLKRRTAPGIDLITTEHLYHANSSSLCTALSNVYTVMLMYYVVPEVLQIGIIIPILKKPTLSQSDFNNYRPITLCSVHAKMIELLMIPNSSISDSQYGYQTGKGAEFCHGFLNDISHYANSGDSPVYLCTLDAVKCFDSIWHDGLFYKLINRISTVEWRYLYHWYSSLTGILRVNDTDSKPFQIQKGTRQGSIISPHLFNIYIDDLLVELMNSPYGIHIKNHIYNSIAYADDITLLSLTVSDMQDLINMCYNYSIKWRFTYGIKKTFCLTIGNKNTVKHPNLHLGNEQVKNVNSTEILGYTFNTCGTSIDHISNRIQRARKSMQGIGLFNEMLCPKLKAHIWNAVGVPSLTYSIGTNAITHGELKLLQSTQGTIIKGSLYLNKKHRHSKLLEAMGVKSISEMIDRQRKSLLSRIFKVSSTYTTLCLALMSQYTQSGHTAKGTLIQNISDSGESPMRTMLNLKQNKQPKKMTPDGVRDSIANLLSDNIKPGSHNHTLLKGLTNAF